MKLKALAYSLLLGIATFAFIKATNTHAEVYVRFAWSMLYVGTASIPAYKLLWATLLK